MTTRNVAVAVVDLRRAVGLINATALAYATVLHSTIKFDEFSRNQVINALLIACTGQPGFAEVEENFARVAESRERLAKTFLNRFLSALQQSPADVAAYLAHLQGMKSVALQQMRDIYQETSKINADIEQALAQTTSVLAKVKFASTVAIAVTPVGLGLAGAQVGIIATASAISFVYSVTKGTAKNMGKEEAKVIAVDFGKDLAKETSEEAIEAIGQEAEKAAAQRFTTNSGLLAEAQSRIQNLSAELARKVSSRKISKLGRQVNRAQAAAGQASKTMARASTVKLAAKAIPIVFAAVDIWDAIEEYKSDMAGP